MSVSDDFLTPCQQHNMLALDCEMVLTVDGILQEVARVSVVDEQGQVVMDTFVRPQHPGKQDTTYKITTTTYINN
jgi:hypothetical protein